MSATRVITTVAECDDVDPSCMGNGMSPVFNHSEHKFFGQEIISDKYFLFTQGSPSNTWVVNHNFGRYANVLVLDSTGREVWGNRQHTINQVIITFSMVLSGTVACS